jgi:hypothetical protein
MTEMKEIAEDRTESSTKRGLVRAQRRPHANTEKAFADRVSIQRALVQSVRDALRLHKRAGNPIYGWANGKLVRVEPHKIRIDDDDQNGT